MLAKIRRLTQILFFLFFIYLFLLARYPYGGAPPADIFLRFSPLMPLFDGIRQWHISWHFWPALLILFITPFLGRVFCGWVCPLGTLLDITAKIVPAPDKRHSGKWHKLRYLKFALLVFLILSSLFSVSLWGYFDPLSVFNRALTVVFYPFFTMLTEHTLLVGQNLPLVGPGFDFIYDVFKDVFMPENQAHLQQVFWIFLFIAALLALETISRRFWCRYLCPAGALLGFLSQFRLLERVVAASCPACNICQTTCKMNAIPKDDLTRTSKVECIQCFNCAAACPQNFKSISYRWRWRPYRSKVDFSRRQFLSTSAVSVAAVGLISIGLPAREQEDRLIRPPGALPEDEFLAQCIRCEECIRICASNGACLQPGAIQSSLLQLWAPLAVMREGYCEYNCNLCTQVCPTQALRPLTLAEKQTDTIGLAVFDKNSCIPYKQNKDCLVCEEHCPTPQKAIKFQIKEVIHTDGSRKKVKFPYVDETLCIGCGICEYKCPLPGKAGIIVYKHTTQTNSPYGSA